MRFHLCAAFYVVLFMRFYELTRAEKAAVYIVIGAVISLEAVNTAVEAVVDLVSPEHNKLAGIAKDCAAAAVLAAAAASVAVGYLVFWDTEVFGRIFDYFRDNITMLVLFVLSLAVWFCLIFIPNGKRKDIQNDKH